MTSPGKKDWLAIRKAKYGISEDEREQKRRDAQRDHQRLTMKRPPTPDVVVWNDADSKIEPEPFVSIPQAPPPPKRRPPPGRLFGALKKPQAQPVSIDFLQNILTTVAAVKLETADLQQQADIAIQQQKEDRDQAIQQFKDNNNSKLSQFRAVCAKVKATQQSIERRKQAEALINLKKQAPPQQEPPQQEPPQQEPQQPEPQRREPSQQENNDLPDLEDTDSDEDMPDLEEPERVPSEVTDAKAKDPEEQGRELLELIVKKEPAQKDPDESEDAINFMDFIASEPESQPTDEFEDGRFESVLDELQNIERDVMFVKKLKYDQPLSLEVFEGVKTENPNQGYDDTNDTCTKCGTDEGDMVCCNVRQCSKGGWFCSSKTDGCVRDYDHEVSRFRKKVIKMFTYKPTSTKAKEAKRVFPQKVIDVRPWACEGCSITKEWTDMERTWRNTWPRWIELETKKYKKWDREDAERKRQKREEYLKKHKIQCPECDLKLLMTPFSDNHLRKSEIKQATAELKKLMKLTEPEFDDPSLMTTTALESHYEKEHCPPEYLQDQIPGSTPIWLCNFMTNLSLTECSRIFFNKEIALLHQHEHELQTDGHGISCLDAMTMDGLKEKELAPQQRVTTQSNSSKQKKTRKPR